MAEEILVKDPLTEQMIETGAKLTDRLDDLGLDVQAALWLFGLESNEWRLLIASPLASAGSRAVYEKVAEARESLGIDPAHLPLATVWAVAPDHDLVRILTGTLPAGRNVMRLSRTAIEGHFIDDALIYRVPA